MKFVQQIYAGWLGVVSDTHFTSGVFVATLDNARRSQLAEVEPSIGQIKQLLNDYNNHFKYDQHNFRKFMEECINATQPK